MYRPILYLVRMAHSEDDEKGPLNFYGESKLMSEQFVAASGLRYTIIRPVLFMERPGRAYVPVFALGKAKS